MTPDPLTASPQRRLSRQDKAASQGDMPPAPQGVTLRGLAANALATMSHPATQNTEGLCDPALIAAKAMAAQHAA